MINCLYGALLCVFNANITIDGPLAYAQPATASYAYNYAAYSVIPTRQATPTVFVLGRGRT